MGKKSNALHIYVDGSWSNDKKQVGSAAVILSPEGKIIQALQETHYKNIKSKALIGEIRSVQLALNALGTIDKGILKKYPIILYHDFDALNPHTDKIKKVRSSEIKQYYDWLKKFLNTHPKLKISFQKVKAHSGVKYNNYVDKLAKQAANLPKIN